MIKRKYNIAYVTYSIIESLVTLISFLLSYQLRKWLPSNYYFGPLFPFRNYVGLLVVVLLLWILLFALLRSRQHSILPQDPWIMMRETAILVFSGSVLIGTAIFALKYDFISRPFILIFAAVNFTSLLLFRLYARSSLHLFQNVLDGEKNILIVGVNEKAGRLAETLVSARQWGYRTVGVVRDTPEAPVDSRLLRYPLLELDKLSSIITERVIDEVVFAVSIESLSHLEEIFLLCEEEGVKTRVMLSFFPHVTSKVYLEALHDLPLLTFTTTPQNEYLLFLKNAADLLLAAGLLVLLSPLLALVALLIKTTSGGPVIFRQVRCGLGGRQFVLYKFRSMIPGADALKQELEHLNEMSGPVFKISQDPRCTPIGRILRKLSIDEFPQLVNILKGDMAFVGPRPPLPKEVAEYKRWQRRRLRMKPGLTCLWQISGRNEIDFNEWMRLDLQYIDDWSLLLDLMIFLKTIPLVFLGRGAR